MIQRRKLEAFAQAGRRLRGGRPARQVIESAIRNYETAFQMQARIPELADVGKESEATRRLYGLDSANDYQKYYSLQCLRARRLVEAGVRFVEITCPLTHANNSPWDQHASLKKYHDENALITDQAVAALIQDLKQRGLLDTTVVLWAGEMGRTPHTPKINDTAGRDHHVNGYSIFMAGGGFKPGLTYGSTDDFGNSVVEHPTTIHDVHATILHQLGLNHQRLTFRFGGRDVSSDRRARRGDPRHPGVTQLLRKQACALQKQPLECGSLLPPSFCEACFAPRWTIWMSGSGVLRQSLAGTSLGEGQVSRRSPTRSSPCRTRTAPCRPRQHRTCVPRPAGHRYRCGRRSNLR